MYNKIILLETFRTASLCNISMNLKLIKKTFSLQHDQSDCGVACLLSLIQYYGGVHTLEELRILSGTTREGTTLLGLYQAANQLGFEAEGNEATIEVLKDYLDPLILHVKIEELEHYIVCYGYKDGFFIIGDPAKGVEKLSTEELDKLWVSKACLTLSPTEKFQRKKSEQQAQWTWLLGLVKEDARLLTLSAVLGIIIAILGLAMAIFSQKLIDSILPSKDLDRLWQGILLLTLLLVARIAIAAVREYFLLIQTKDFNNRINKQFFIKLLHLPKFFFDTRKIGELVARLNDTQRIQRVIKQLVSSTFIDSIVVVVTTIFLFSYSWKIALFTLLSIPIYFIILYKNNTKIIHLQQEVMQSYATVESNYINSLQGINEIKINNRQGIFAKVNDFIFATSQEKLLGLGKMNIHLSLVSGLVSVFFLVSVLLYGSLRVLRGELLLGELMAILTMVSSLLPSILNLALVSIPINEAKVAFSRMYHFTAIDAETSGGYTLDHIDTLTLQKVTFRFVGRSPILSHLSLQARKGELVSIIGENGCGKSTLANILLQFYTPEEGSIYINEQSLSDISLESYRKLVAYIPQEVTIFNGNVLDNILLGENSSKEEILSFLKEYHFENYFNTFPQGLATQLGEGGVNLSGGQKQLIAFARALLKKPELLILDEATSAMDRETEQFIHKLLLKLKSHCLILFITHRLHSLETISDRICILQRGRIVLSGTHDTLIQTSNFYSDFFR